MQTKRMQMQALGGALVAALGTLLLLAGPARADHSLNLGCLVCHSLRSAGVVTGSRNIACSNVDDPLYGYAWDGTTCSKPSPSYWYCPSHSSNSVWDPGAGEPLDCSYCHDTGADIGVEILNATNLFYATTPSPTSFHPVDVNGSARNIGSMRCNDCHNADVSPSTACSKTSDDGYPNHQNVQMDAKVAPTGTNQRTGTAAHVDGTYDLTDGTTFCLECHGAGGNSPAGPDINTAYSNPNGGHNITTMGSALNIKLPCYDCHDPHASVENDYLLIDTTYDAAGRANPFGTSYEGFTPGTGYSGETGVTGYGEDYRVCLGCHGGANTLDHSGMTGGASVDLHTVVGTLSPRFPFHANAHNDVTATTTCLQKNNGCHADAHDTDIYRCLDCHSTTVTAAMSSPPARLLAFDHVDADFGGPDAGFAVGAVQFARGASDANPDPLDPHIRSQHDIPYTPGPGIDMAVPANNGCLACHNVPAGTAVSGAKPMVYDSGGSTAYGRPTGGWGGRADLAAYDPFCSSCHDGSWESFAPPGDTLVAPWVSLYFTESGHGLGSGSFPTPSTNEAHKIPCLECHMYHGSSAYKLLPGHVTVPDGDNDGARVVKGRAEYVTQTTGTLFPIGDDQDSTKIDYRDYTNPDFNSRLTRTDMLSGYLSNYTSQWSTYGTQSPLAPAAVANTYKFNEGFGTSGDIFPNDNNGGASLLPSGGTCPDATDASEGSTGAKIGFCNACHFYKNDTDGTDSNAAREKWPYTHEGDPNQTLCDGTTPTGARNTFFKDCVECHDPHGSGDDAGGGTNDNAFMIRGKVKYGLTADQNDVEGGSWGEVVFQSRTSTNSFDEDDTGTDHNRDDLCAVCHVNSGDPSVNYHYYSGEDTHMEGTNCMNCHPHVE